MHRIILLLLMLLAGLTVGCNTVDGIGKVIEQGGKAIQKSTK
jgi:predicted small secreted protein